MLRVIICGANGKMGQAVAGVVAETEDAQVVAGVDLFTERANPFPVYQKIRECPQEADVIIDFSRPAALAENLAYAKETGTPIVIATTGYTPEDKASIAACAEHVAVFFSANMSLGVNLQMDLCQQAARFFGKKADIEIIEKHHNLKVDAPSGTALALADAINDSLGNQLDYTYGRHGRDAKRTDHEIGIHAIRGGRIVGEHDVMFITNDEVVTVSHHAESRQVFAIGAVRAAGFIAGREPGLYSMQDIIHEHRTMTDVTVIPQEAVITLRSIPHDIALIAKVFSRIAEQGINVDIITQSAPQDEKVDLSFSLNSEDISKAQQTLGSLEEKIDFQIVDDLTKIIVEGVGMQTHHGVAAKLFSVLANENINIMFVTTSATKITFCVYAGDGDRAVQGIADSFHLHVR